MFDTSGEREIGLRLIPQGDLAGLWGEQIASLGICSLPWPILLLMERLGIQPVEVALLAHAIHGYRTPGKWPSVNISQVASRMGMSRRHIGQIAKGLEEKGILRIEPVRGSSPLFDLSPLIARMETLIAEHPEYLSPEFRAPRPPRLRLLALAEAEGDARPCEPEFAPPANPASQLTPPDAPVSEGVQLTMDLGTVDPVIRATWEVLNRYPDWKARNEAREIENLEKIRAKYVQRYSFLYIDMPDRAEAWLEFFTGVLNGEHRGASGKVRPPKLPIQSFDNWMNTSVTNAARARGMSRAEADVKAEELERRREQTERGRAASERKGSEPGPGVRSERDHGGFARSDAAAERLLRMRQERAARGRREDPPGEAGSEAGGE